MIDTKLIPDLLSVSDRAALDSLLAVACGCPQYQPDTPFDIRTLTRLEAIGLARWDTFHGERLTPIGRWIAVEFARVDAELENIRRSGLVRFAAPSDWREQLDGADPVRLLETWIEPWDDAAEVGR